MYPRGFSFSGSYQVIIIIIFVVQTIIDFFLLNSFVPKNCNLFSMENLSVISIWCILFTLKCACDLHSNKYATSFLKFTFEGRIWLYTQTEVKKFELYEYILIYLNSAKREEISFCLTDHLQITFAIESLALTRCPRVPNCNRWILCLANKYRVPPRLLFT